jgi:hypothetical protein
MTSFERIKKSTERRIRTPSVENRRFFRVECVLRAEFRLHNHDFWLPADVLDLSVAGMKVRFNPFQRGRTLRPDVFEWADSRFRFPLRTNFFHLDGHFLKVYVREAGLFTAGVEFEAPSPEDQFKLVELYADFRRRSAPS